MFPTKTTKNTSTLKDVNLKIIKKKMQHLKNDFLKFKKDDIDLINLEIKKAVDLF